MNSNQTTQPAEQVGLGKRFSGLWNSRSRRARFAIVLMSGLVLNCCCLIIPLWGSWGGR